MKRGDYYKQFKTREEITVAMREPGAMFKPGTYLYHDSLELFKEALRRARPND